MAKRLPAAGQRCRCVRLLPGNVHLGVGRLASAARTTLAGAAEASGHRPGAGLPATPPRSGQSPPRPSRLGCRAVKESRPGTAGVGGRAGRTVTTGIDEGVANHSEPLTGLTIPYIKASVYAVTGAIGPDNVPVANTGVVYIMTGEGFAESWGPLSPGQSMALPDNCELGAFRAAVYVRVERVLIVYTR